MNEIHLHRLDLNLLVTFDALMETRSVTVAAEKLGRTQSAVSHALRRLREQLDDPLMVKVGGKMQPSPFALRLIEDIRPILRSIERVVTPPAPFDPATSERTFRVALLTIPGLMSRVFERVNAEAPNVNLEWTSPSQRAYSQVAEGLVDLAMLGNESPLPEGVSQRVMAPTRACVFARTGHPALDGWSLAEWLRWPHLVVGLGTVARTTVDQGIADAGQERRVGARIPDFGGIAPVLARTDYLATSLGIALVDDIDRYGLSLAETPVAGIDPSFAFLWSSRLANDPGIAWLRDIAFECFEELTRFAEEKMAERTMVSPKE